MISANGFSGFLQNFAFFLRSGMLVWQENNREQTPLSCFKTGQADLESGPPGKGPW